MNKFYPDEGRRKGYFMQHNQHKQRQRRASVAYAVGWRLFDRTRCIVQGRLSRVVAEGLAGVWSWRLVGATLLRLAGSLKTGLGGDSLRRAGFLKNHFGCNAEKEQSEDVSGGEETSEEVHCNPGESPASSKEYGEHLLDLRDTEKMNWSDLVRGFKGREASRTTSRFLSWRAMGREVLMVEITRVDCVTDIIVSGSYGISHLTFTITLWDWDCCFFSKWGKQDSKVLNNLPNVTQLLLVDVTLNSWHLNLDHCAVWTPGHRWRHRCLS